MSPFWEVGCGHEVNDGFLLDECFGVGEGLEGLEAVEGLAVVGFHVVGVYVDIPFGENIEVQEYGMGIVVEVALLEAVLDGALSEVEAEGKVAGGYSPEG